MRYHGAMSRLRRSFLLKRIQFVLIITLILFGAALPARGQEPVSTHYLLGRPLPKNRNLQPDWGFPYGWHNRGQSPIHHGIDIPNPSGTTVLAAADGIVFFAGSDAENVVGPQPNFYGNIVIIQHNFAAPEGGTVFTLYGHLKQVLVQTGQQVTAGEKIGLVGMTGIAIGPHLHFEVRVGNPQDYNATRNPQLWYAPLPGRGALIGRVVDMNGNIAMGVRYVVSNTSSVFPGFTYAEPSIAVDPTYNENFAMNDLRAGCYRLRIRGGAGYAVDQSFCVKAGETIFIEAKLKQ
jgi:murein DD-endopeptidase MepM/ murein hydrolase activator NlpD